MLSRLRINFCRAATLGIGIVLVVFDARAQDPLARLHPTAPDSIARIARIQDALNRARALFSKGTELVGEWEKIEKDMKGMLGASEAVAATCRRYKDHLAQSESKSQETKDNWAADVKRCESDLAERTLTIKRMQTVIGRVSDEADFVKDSIIRYGLNVKEHTDYLKFEQSVQNISKDTGVLSEGLARHRKESAK